MVNFKESVYENKYLRRYVKDIEKSKNISSRDTYRKLVWVCPECREESLSTPSEVRTRGFRCYFCNPRFKESVYSNNYLRKYVKNIEESKKISSSSKEYIEWKCPNCSRKVRNSPYNVKNTGFVCPECRPKFKESVYGNEYMIKYVKDKENSKIISSKSDVKIDWECPKCKRIKKSSPFSVSRNGFICFNCSTQTSYPERLMTEILKANKVNYDTQVTFEGCKNKKHLPFDFAIYDNEGNLECLVEMQGEHHYLKGKHGRWDTNLVRITDSIKKEYCYENNIKMVTIECKKSDFHYILKSIKKTELKFLIDNIDKTKLKMDSLIRENDLDISTIINFYLLGVNYKNIARYFNKSSFIIVNLLKKIGYYDKYRETNKYSNIVYMPRKYVFKSIHEATLYMNLPNDYKNEVKRSCEYLSKYKVNSKNNKKDWIYITDYIKEYGFEGLSFPINI